MAFFEYVREYAVVRGRVPRFVGDTDEYYTAREYPELGRMKTVRMFALAGNEHPGLIPEFLVRRYWPGAVDLSGQFTFNPVSRPKRLDVDSVRVTSFARQYMRQQGLKGLEVPDEL